MQFAWTSHEQGWQSKYSVIIAAEGDTVKLVPESYPAGVNPVGRVTAVLGSDSTAAVALISSTVSDSA